MLHVASGQRPADRPLIFVKQIPDDFRNSVQDPRPGKPLSFRALTRDDAGGNAQFPSAGKVQRRAGTGRETAFLRRRSPPPSPSPPSAPATGTDRGGAVRIHRGIYEKACRRLVSSLCRIASASRGASKMLQDSEKAATELNPASGGIEQVRLTEQRYPRPCPIAVRAWRVLRQAGVADVPGLRATAAAGRRSGEAEKQTMARADFQMREACRVTAYKLVAKKSQHLRSGCAIRLGDTEEAVPA